jgi:hypothetical protein
MFRTHESLSCRMDEERERPSHFTLKELIAADQNGGHPPVELEDDSAVELGIENHAGGQCGFIEVGLPPSRNWPNA